MNKQNILNRRGTKKNFKIYKQKKSINSKRREHFLRFFFEKKNVFIFLTIQLLHFAKVV